MFFAARSIQYWSSLRSTNILSYLSFSIFFILSNASPQKHLTEFFFVALSPTFARCFSQTLTTCGSNSNQSINPKFLEIHSLATPPSPPPIIAAVEFFFDNLSPEFYSFYRSLTAYRESFNAKQDVLVIKPDSDFFKYFTDPQGTK